LGGESEKVKAGEVVDARRARASEQSECMYIYVYCLANAVQE
jgi:hypothetical protein